MAKDSDHSAGALDADHTGGLLSGLLAEENELDRRALWRIGSWGFAAVGAVVVAVTASQSSLGWRREQLAGADLARQAQQIQSLARASQNETRRLSSAIDTLNTDRDRLYSRVTVLEQGLDSVTGAIAKQSAAAAPPASEAPAGPPASPSQASSQASLYQAQPLPPIAPVATAPTATTEKPRSDTMKPPPNTATAPTAKDDKPRESAKPPPNIAMAVPAPAPVVAPAPSAAPASLGPAKSMMGPPDPAAPKMIEMPRPPASATAAAPSEAPQAAKEPAAGAADAPKAAVQRTEFAVDLGTASSIGGLRALWRGILRSNAELATLHPIIVVRESSTGLGMQLRLAAGPLQDAATAAKICAALLENERGCETTVFDGQRLAMGADESQPPSGAKQAPAIKQAPTKRGYYSRHGSKDDAPQAKQDPSVLSAWFGSSRR
jgi:hypothetical protein